MGTVPHGARGGSVRRDIGRLGCTHERGCAAGRLGARTRPRCGFPLVHTGQGPEIGGLSGFALNLDDGRVQVVAEGPRRGCERLLDWLRGDDTPGPRRRCHRDLGHTPRRLRRLRHPLSRLRTYGPGGSGGTCHGQLPKQKELVVAKNRLPWQAPHARMIATPRGPRRSRSAAVQAARPGLPANTGRDRVDRQTFW